MGIYENVSKILSSGVASANRYEVIYSGHGGYFQDVIDLNAHSKYLVSSATVPGRSFTTGQIRGDMGLGVERKYVTGIMFNEFTLTYTLTGDMRVHQLMNNWAEDCAPRISGASTGRKDIRIAYYEDYVDPKIIIKKLERDGSVSMVTNVYNAYPIMVADLSLASGSNNSALEFSVQFAYETFDNIYGGLSSEQVAGGYAGYGDAVSESESEDGKQKREVGQFEDKKTIDNIETGYEEGIGTKQAIEEKAKVNNSANDGGKGDSYSQGEIDAHVADELTLDMF
tara:strand:- start:16736 stop:17584 length:849 start_codon:yes stop_codon:yes gene_type:complete